MHPVVLKGVARTYRLDAVDVPALVDIDLVILPDRFTVISGPSGSGKTTLLNLIGCIDRPDRGTIMVSGKPVQTGAYDARLLRHLPLFVVPGSGRFRLQPVYVEDLARICVEVGLQGDDVVLDAVGPETYSFDELVQCLDNELRNGRFANEAIGAHGESRLFIGGGQIAGGVENDGSGL